jgi:signal transduction histidine kinase
MSPSASSRFRQWTAIAALAWAVLAGIAGLRARIEIAAHPTLPFAFSNAAGIAVVHAATPNAAKAGLEPLDRILSVNTQPFGLWLRRGGALGLEPDQALRIEFEKPAGQIILLSLRPVPAGERPFYAESVVSWAVPVVGLAYLAIGFVVWRLKRERRESWALLIFTSVTSALLFLAGPTAPLVGLMVGITVPFVGATAFHLFTTYPIEPGWIIRQPGWRSATYGAATLLGVASVAQPWLGPVAPWVEPSVTAFPSLITLACLGIVLSGRIENRRHPSASRADVMLLGAAASFLPVIFILGWHVIWGTRFPWMTSFLGFFVFPLAVGYGIVRRELFDVRFAARSSAAYGAATLAITGLFALLITSATEGFRQLSGDEPSPVFSVPFVFLAILAFNPVRERLQAFVDRFFDRDRAAYRRAVREISEAMVSMLSAREIVDRILVALTATMGVERALVLLVDEAGEEVLRVEATRGDWDEEAEEFSLAPDHPVCRGLWTRRRELARDDFDEEPDPEMREQSRDVFDTLDVELLVPVLFGVDLLGVIAVGRKLTGERLGTDERQLLHTLANQSAIAIENARAFDEIAQLNRTLEARVDDRTRELRETQAQLMQSEKMRSLGQLVAGVAHELNNPIGFVHANLALLDEYVDRLSPEVPAPKRTRAREAIQKLLSRSVEGTTRVKDIVQNLRDFSRTDQADLQKASLNEEIDRTLGLMEPRLKGGVEIERDYGDLPVVRCFAGQLNQVFTNLLMNACDALDGRGTIRIRTRPEGDTVLLEFEDDGPGMPEEIRDRIFEPFYTTKPVGQGTGLGLSISHGIVAGHGGEMEVRSVMGQGTTFSIRLPLEPPPEIFEQAFQGGAV